MTDNYEYLVLGTGNPLHPDNQETVSYNDTMTFDEVMNEVKDFENAKTKPYSSVIEERVRELEYQNQKLKALATSYRNHLEELQGVEEMKTTFGRNTEAEKAAIKEGRIPEN